jgi:hypothetical protein
MFQSFQRSRAICFRRHVAERERSNSEYKKTLYSQKQSINGNNAQDQTPSQQQQQRRQQRRQQQGPQRQLQQRHAQEQ